jgi:hypothetical protein
MNHLENSLIKHVNTIQYFKITKRPTTKILSSLVNLKSLVVHNDMEWSCLKNLSSVFTFFTNFES